MSNRNNNNRPSVSPQQGRMSSSSNRDTALGQRNERSVRPGVYGGFDDIFDNFKRNFDELLAPYVPYTGLSNWTTETPFARYPLVDLEDHGDYYTVTAELPGFTKDQVDVQVNKDMLQIWAENKQQTEQKDKNYLHHERAYSSFQRAISFPEEVNPSRVDGSMKDGVLELRIPKKEPKPEERLTKVNLR